MENSNSQTTRPRISASEILRRLQGEPGQGGETREEIRVSLGLSHKEAKMIFSSAGLKGRKTIKPVTTIEFVDDLAQIPADSATTNTTTNEEPAPEVAPEVAPEEGQTEAIEAEEEIFDDNVVDARQPFDR